MRKLSVLGAIIIFFLMGSDALANLSILRIGNNDVSKSTLTTYNFTGPVPEIVGLAGPDEEVKIVVNSTIATVSAGYSGSWVFVPTALRLGANDFSLSTATESLSFVMVYATQSAVGSSSPAALPETGLEVPVVLLLLSGMGIWWLAYVVKTKIDEAYEN